MKCCKLIIIRQIIPWSLGLCVYVVKVQSKVGLKYDAWHKEIVSKFGNMLGTEMLDFHGQVSKVCNTDVPFLFHSEQCSNHYIKLYLM